MNNFAVMDIAFTHYAAGLKIVLPTNNPCHLTCYYTPTKPRRHKAFRTLRGLTTTWGSYWCYVGWLTVEQNEPGDTLTHTFDFPQWIFCQTNWLAFRGTVNGQTSPSVSPIFKHHHPGPGAQIEEQTIATTTITMFYDLNLRMGQQLIIPNREITHLGFWLYQYNSPWGDVTFTIRKLSDDTLIASKVWGDAADLHIGLPATYEEVELDTPVTINEQVKILAEFSDGDYVNKVGFGLSSIDVKPNEYFAYYRATGWLYIETFDAAYRYIYYQR